MKALIWILGLVLITIVGSGAYIVLNSGGLIKSAIEDLGRVQDKIRDRIGEGLRSLTDRLTNNA